MEIFETSKINWEIYCNQEKQEIEVIPFVYVNEQTEVKDLRTNKILDAEEIHDNGLLKQYRKDVKGFEPLRWLSNGPIWGTFSLLNFWKSKIGLRGKDEELVYKSYAKKYILSEEDIETIQGSMEQAYTRYLKNTHKKVDAFKKYKKDNTEKTIE